LKSIYSRKYSGDQIIGQCHWCKRDLRRDDPYIVEPHDVIYKRFIHHSPMHKCFEEYSNQQKNKEPNALDNFWKHLGK